MFNTNQSKQLHVKVTEGQGLVEADIPKTVKQTIKVPKTYFEALSMIRNFHSLLSLLFNPESAVAEGVSTWVNHMLENETIYEARQNDDTTFLTQILFEIDSIIQVHL